MPDLPSATIVIPTRLRASYLDVALGSIAPQAGACGAEVVVVSDGPDLPTEAVVWRHRATRIELPAGAGANAARNAGVAAARGELIVFTDDDVETPPGWLEALLSAAAGAPEVAVFGGPVRAQLEGGGPRACGHEPPPITTLDLGPVDRDCQLVWSANMAVRARAFATVGPFDETIRGRGEEEDWERRHLALGGRIRYVAGAGLVHRRNRDDARVGHLARSAYHLGRSARRYDARKGHPPPLRAELRTLAGCGWHTVRRRCAYGVVMGAHSAGRVHEALVTPRP